LATAFFRLLRDFAFAACAKDDFQRRRFSFSDTLAKGKLNKGVTQSVE